MASERGLGKGLGKGLGALLGDAALQNQEGGSVSLPIAQVEPGLKQPRKRFDPETLADLAESICTHGIIQPLTVRRLGSGYYQIIAGERRWRVFLKSPPSSSRPTTGRSWSWASSRTSSGRT